MFARPAAGHNESVETPGPPRLTCGIVLHTWEDECRIAAAGHSACVRYAPLFPAPRRERVLPGHLVAVAAAADSAVVVWRWYDAVVLASDAAAVRLWEPPTVRSVPGAAGRGSTGKPRSAPLPVNREDGARVRMASWATMIVPPHGGRCTG